MIPRRIKLAPNPRKSRRYQHHRALRGRRPLKLKANGLTEPLTLFRHRVARRYALPSLSSRDTRAFQCKVSRLASGLNRRLHATLTRIVAHPPNTTEPMT